MCVEIYHFLHSCRQDKAFCLLNKPSVDMLALYRLNEKIPSPNQQCQLSLGLTAKAVMMHDYDKVIHNNELCLYWSISENF